MAARLKQDAAAIQPIGFIAPGHAQAARAEGIATSRATPHGRAGEPAEREGATQRGARGQIGQRVPQPRTGRRRSTGRARSGAVDRRHLARDRALRLRPDRERRAGGEPRPGEAEAERGERIGQSRCRRARSRSPVSAQPAAASASPTSTSARGFRSSSGMIPHCASSAAPAPIISTMPGRLQRVRPARRAAGRSPGSRSPGRSSPGHGPSPARRSSSRGCADRNSRPARIALGGRRGRRSRRSPARRSRDRRSPRRACRRCGVRSSGSSRAHRDAHRRAEQRERRRPGPASPISTAADRCPRIRYGAIAGPRIVPSPKAEASSVSALVRSSRRGLARRPAPAPPAARPIRTRRRSAARR